MTDILDDLKTSLHSRPIDPVLVERSIAEIERLRTIIEEDRDYIPTAEEIAAAAAAIAKTANDPQVLDAIRKTNPYFERIYRNRYRDTSRDRDNK